MPAPTIRPVRAEDAAPLQAIYAEIVEKSTISWELVAPTVEEFAGRIERILKGGFPYFVADVNGVAMGYAYASTFRERPGYRFTCESTVYVHQDLRGQGVGKLLYHELFAELKRRGFATVIAGVGIPNPASKALHESVGFRQVAHYTGIGYKFDQWWDALFFQLDLNERLPQMPETLR